MAKLEKMLLSGVIALVCALAMGGGAFAAEVEESGTLGTTGSTVTWTLYDDDTIVLSGGTVNGYDRGGIEWQYHTIWNHTFTDDGTSYKVKLADTAEITLNGDMSSLFGSAEFDDSKFDVSELDFSRINVSNMNVATWMFYRATTGRTFDISGWDMNQVWEFQYMVSQTDAQIINMSDVVLPQAASFNGMICDNDLLTTVYASPGTDWSDCTDMSDRGGGIFTLIGGGKTVLPETILSNAVHHEGIYDYYYNPLLTGGAGTQYTLDKTGMTYARIDGLNGQPGLLTSSDSSENLRTRLAFAKAALVNISTDGYDIPANEYWTTQDEHDAISALIAEAENIGDDATTEQLNDLINRLNAGINAYEAAKKAGKAPSAFTVNSEKSPTYAAYRLFKGNVENINGKNVMSGITVDPSVNATALKTFLASKGYTGDETPQNMAEFIAKQIQKDTGDVMSTEDFAAMMDTFMYDFALDFATNYPNGDFDPNDGDPLDWIRSDGARYDEFLDQAEEAEYDLLTEYGYTGEKNGLSMSRWIQDVMDGIIQVTYPANADAVNAEGFAIVNSDAFAMDLAKWVKTNVQPVTTVQAGNRLQGDEGYYLLINQSVPANWAGTAPIWVPLGGQPVAITEKVAVPAVNKQVREDSLVDPVVENWKSRGTGVAANLARVNIDTINMSFNITGMDPDNPVKPVSVTTRFGLTIPLTQDGTFEKSLTITGNDGGAGSIIVGEPTDDIDDDQYGFDTTSDLMAEMFFLNRFFGGGFEGSYSGLGEIGDCWTITYSDGSTLDVFPDGQVNQTTMIEYSPRLIQSETIMFGENTDRWLVTAPLNDPAPADPSWGKGADAAGNTAVPYRLTANLPANYSSFANYALTFNDQLPEGMSANNIRVKVVNGEGTVNTVDITNLITSNGGTVAYNGQTRMLTVSIPNLKADYLADKGIVANSHIVVEYDGYLTDLNQCQTGTTPNTNTATITYTADPLDLATVKESLPSTANLYTYRGFLIKTDAATQAQLTGAQFTVMKDGKYVQEDGSLSTTRYVFTTSNSANPTQPSPPATTISFPSFMALLSGLDSGEYTIAEVNPPDGYQPFTGNITLTITRTLDQVNGTISDLAASISGGPAGSSVTVTPVQVSDTVTVNDVIALTIPNTKELTMPLTGLLGNAAFYIIAAILAVVAIVGYNASQKTILKKKKAKARR